MEQKQCDSNSGIIGTSMRIQISYIGTLGDNEILPNATTRRFALKMKHKRSVRYVVRGTRSGPSVHFFVRFLWTSNAAPFTDTCVVRLYSGLTQAPQKPASSPTNDFEEENSDF
jgi:hypothetical protein